jgi:hypothetical protein
MATYVPAILITTAAFGNGAANISTWRKQNTAGAGTFDVHRTLVVNTPTAARTVTIEQGSTAADTVTQKLLDAYALTANIPYVQPWWIAVPNNGYFEGFANSTDINGMSSGYNYA